MAEKARDPLEIFPAEIWEFILEKLRKQGSPQDVLNYSKVCTEFERILEPTKRVFGSIFPFIFPYLKGCELLACRKVCKNWCRVVDSCLEDFETRRPFDEGTSDISRSIYYDPLKQKKIKWTSFKYEERLVEFLEVMKKQEMKTPFVGRSVFLEDWGGFGFHRGRGREFFEKALEMLSLYGDHIWHLCIGLPSIDPHQFYQLFKQMLSYMPNLKSLTFNTRFCNLPDVDNRELMNLLEDHPLPEIDSLETLEILTYSLSPTVILEKLITKINLGNLKCLKLHSFSYYGNVDPYAVVRPLQHLTELHVSGINWAQLKHILNNLISPIAPLAKLSLGLNEVLDIADIDFVRVCNILNKWKGTLRMVAINGITNDFLEGRPNLSLSILNALNLKSLELQGILFRSGLLSPALTASLEYLHIRYKDITQPLLGPEMEFYKCVFEAGELHNSSIWDEMKKLKVIRVQRSWRRDGQSSWHRDSQEKVICTREMHKRGVRAKIVEPEFGSDDHESFFI